MTSLETISEKCIQCELCRKECKFLRQYGDPKAIATSFDPTSQKHRATAFECSLCGLCAAVCPAGVSPARMFMEMRQEIYGKGLGEYPQHSAIVGYEKRGTSRRYSYYALPEGCDTVLFPGCTLPGTRPDKVLRLFEHLKQTIPALGIVLDCCAKPSHDLGRRDHFTPCLMKWSGFLSENGVRHVLVACPNCYKVFKQHAAMMSVRTVYELLAEDGVPNAAIISGTVTVHDPCAVRHENSIHAAVRDIIAKTGLTVEEMDHHGNRTVCCGEGGIGGLSRPGTRQELERHPGRRGPGEKDHHLLCGLCEFPDALTPATHVLDLVFEPEAAIEGKVKVSRAPFTYWNRIRLKGKFSAKVNASVTRERVCTPGTSASKSNWVLRVLLAGAVKILKYLTFK